MAELAAPSIGTGRQIGAYLGGRNILLGPYNARPAGPFGPDCSNALQQAITDAAAAGGDQLVICPPVPGGYLITREMVIPSSRIQIWGLGLSGSTFYFQPSANNQALFKYLDGDNIRLVDLDLNMVGTAFTGIRAVDMSNPAVSAVWLERIFVTGFNGFGVILDSAQYLKMLGCRFIGLRSAIGTPAEGIRVNGYLNAGKISHCRFGQNDKDVRIINGTAVGIIHSSFERSGLSTDGLYPRIGATIDRMLEIDTVNGFSFYNNYVEAPVPNGGNAFLYLTNTNEYDIGATAFSGEWMGVGVTDKMIEINGGQGGQIRARFDQIVTSFIQVDASSKPILVLGSFKDAGVEITSYNGVQTLLGGAAVGMIDIDQFGHEVNQTINVGAGAEATYGPFAMSNVGLGDHISVSFDVDLAGLSVVPYVPSAGNVSVRVRNGTGAAYTQNGSLRFFRKRRRT